MVQAERANDGGEVEHPDDAGERLMRGVDGCAREMCAEEETNLKATQLERREMGERDWRAGQKGR